ncbi:MAG: DUF2029 domain-containing protein [Anaerolineae bacterium]|nr:DUF2029 domain-containing protein [Anaerolineae bacterium]
MFGYNTVISKASPQSSSATLALAHVAGMSFLIYLFALVYPYNLFELSPYPRLAVYRFAENNPWMIGWLASVFVIQCGLYWLGWRVAQQARGRAAWLTVLGGALAFSVVLLFLYPFDAADIFDYIMYARISGIYGGNPFREVAQQFGQDPFYPYAAWPGTPSDYGPIWEALAGGVARLAGDSIITNVVAFKLLCGLFLATAIGLVAIILRRVAPERALAGVTLLAWNPVLLYETMGNGHNDIAMAVWLLAATWAILSRRYTLAVLALLLGALIKFIPLLLLPLIGVVALRDLADWRARLRFLTVTTLAGVTLMVIIYSPYWYGLESLGIGRRAQIFTASLPAAIRAWLQLNWGITGIDWQVNAVVASLTLLFVLWQSWRVWREPSWLRFCQATLNILLFYLLLACTWFQQWYLVWPLCVAALLPPGPAVYLTLLSGSYTLLSKHLIFGPLIFKLYPLPENLREIWFAPAVLGLPWLYATLLLKDRALQKFKGGVGTLKVLRARTG